LGFDNEYARLMNLQVVTVNHIFIAIINILDQLNYRLFNDAVLRENVTTAINGESGEIRKQTVYMEVVFTWMP
jgi:hypothetical protein